MDPVAHDLDLLADHLIEQAEASSDGRATRSIDLGLGTLRLMAIGFVAGAELPEHDNPGEAVLQVLRGSVRVVTIAPAVVDGRELGPGRVVEAKPGLLVRIPDARHRVEALEPSVILLTAVSLPGGSGH